MTKPLPRAGLTYIPYGVTYNNNYMGGVSGSSSRGRNSAIHVVPFLPYGRHHLEVTPVVPLWASRGRHPVVCVQSTASHGTHTAGACQRLSLSSAKTAQPCHTGCGHASWADALRPFFSGDELMSTQQRAQAPYCPPTCRWPWPLVDGTLRSLRWQPARKLTPCATPTSDHPENRLAEPRGSARCFLSPHTR